MLGLLASIKTLTKTYKKILYCVGFAKPAFEFYIAKHCKKYGFQKESSMT